MNIAEAIAFINNQITDPSKGLSDEIFYFVSQVTPLVNVDLLIKDEDDRTLLAWRDDKYSGTGWHIPGGIVRFQEKFETRINKVAESEVGTHVEYDLVPIAINELINPELEARNHFISFLYRCFLSKNHKIDNKGRLSSEPRFLAWHDKCPNNLIIYHKNYYKQYI